MLKVLLQQLQGTFTMAFKRHLTAENFTNVDQHTFNFLLAKGVWCVKAAWEVISWTKIRACSSKNIGPRHFTYYCILLFFSKKPSF